MSSDQTDIEIWDNAAQTWGDKVTGPGTARSVHFKNAVEELLPNPEKLSVLDAGCGDGVFTEYFSLKGANVIGIDGSPQMIKIAKQKYPELRFEVSDLLKPLSFRDKWFDVVFANMVLMHLSETSLFLSECRRVLKPSGSLIFSILHPAFNFPTMKLHKSLTDKILQRPPSGLSHDYYQTKHKRRFESVLDKTVTHYHRTLEQYSKDLNKNGFAINLMLEPHELSDEFLEKNPKLEYTTRLPRFIFIKASLA